MTDRYGEIVAIARAAQLDVFGAFHPGPDDGTPEGTGTLLLLGPYEPGFWSVITDSPEWLDGAPDPVDRWSTRVVGEVARNIVAQPIFPFGGPPFQPFIHWAKRSGRAWSSPVDILVHDIAGLLVSYRGALALSETLPLPALPARPCDTCADKPCLSACPAAALTSSGYDVPKCHKYLTSNSETRCMTNGCEVRTSCPVSQRHVRAPGQSAYHMRQFLT